MLQLEGQCWEGAQWWQPMQLPPQPQEAGLRFWLEQALDVLGPPPAPLELQWAQAAAGAAARCPALDPVQQGGRASVQQQRSVLWMTERVKGWGQGPLAHHPLHQRQVQVLRQVHSQIQLQRWQGQKLAVQ